MDSELVRIQRTLAKILRSISEESDDVLEKALYRLTEWLQHPRVYHNPHMRKQVLCLLVAADLRIRKEVGFSENIRVPFNVASYRSPEHPSVEAYARLLEAVLPFQSQLKDSCEHPAIATIFASNNGLRSTLEFTGLPNLSEVVKTSQPTASRVTGEVEWHPHFDEKPYHHADSKTVTTQAEPTSEVKMPTPLQKSAQKQLEGVSQSIPEKQPHTPSVPAAKPTDISLVHKVSTTTTSPQQGSAGPATVSGAMPNALTQRRKTKTRRSINFLAKFDEEDQFSKKSRPTHESPMPSLSNSLPQPRVTAIQGSFASLPDQATPWLDPIPVAEDTDSHSERNLTTMTGQRAEVLGMPESNTKETTTANASTGPISENDSMIAGVVQMRLTDPPGPIAANGEETLVVGKNTQLLDLMESSVTLTTESSTNQASTMPAQASQQTSLWNLPPCTDADSLFGPDLRILGVKPGRREHTYISIELYLPEADFAALKYWKASKSATCLKDVEKSFCISMACYRREDLSDDINQIKSQVSVLASSWPQYPASGSLLIKTVAPELNVPLSPPFYLTPDKLIDMSAWVHLGKTQLGIQQQGMEDYAFVILLHRPTQKQLQQVSSARLNDLAWQHFLDGFSAPMKYTPLRSLAMTPN